MPPSIEERLSALEAWARAQGFGAEPPRIPDGRPELPVLPPAVDGFAETAERHRQQREGGR